MDAADAAVWFRGVRCPPSEEQGVVVLFALLLERLGFEIEHIRTEFPDCIAWRTAGGERTKVRIEFEFRSGGFNHSSSGCDIVVCWEEDARLGGVEVIELRSVIEGLTGAQFAGQPAMTLEQYMGKRSFPDRLRPVYERLDAALQDLTGVSVRLARTPNAYIRYQLQGHPLVWMYLRSECVQLDVYTAGQPLDGVGSSKCESYKPVHARELSDVPEVLSIIAESYRRLKADLRAGVQKRYGYRSDKTPSQ
jgi:hypothetical protein